MDNEFLTGHQAAGDSRTGQSQSENINRVINQETVPADTKESMRMLHKISSLLNDQIAEAANSLTQHFSVSSAVMSGVSKVKEAVSELIELDSILSEIGRTSDLTSGQLEALGSSAFDSASKYSVSAADYLTTVQEMYRAGFQNAQEMAELSLLAQAVGDLESDTANNYLTASNAAYNYRSNAEELNKVLNAQNYITENTAVRMQDMADATTESAAIAAQYGVQMDELSALIAVAASKTGDSGSEVGNALKNIFAALQDTADKPVVDAFQSFGISMTKMVDDAEKLKTPIELLQELSSVFNELPAEDPKLENILSNIGSDNYTDTLSAILSDWGSYESMLDLYSRGTESTAEEVEKNTGNIKDSLTRLSNTWTGTISNIISPDAINTAVNALNGLLSVVNKITGTLGSSGTIGLGAGLFAGLNNVGGDKKYSLNCYLF